MIRGRFQRDRGEKGRGGVSMAVNVLGRGVYSSYTRIAGLQQATTRDWRRTNVLLPQGFSWMYIPPMQWHRACWFSWRLQKS